MTTRRITDEDLVALADNELPAAEAADLRAALANDADAAERFAIFAETRMLLSRPGRDDKQVSDALRSAILRADAESSRKESRSIGPGKASFGHPSRHRSLPRSSRNGLGARGWQMPMAAALLLSLGGLSGYLIGQHQRDGNTAIGSAMMTVPGADRALSRLLDTAVSGSEASITDQAGEELRIVVLSTHRLGDGTFCREFEIKRRQESLLGASCRRDNAWRTEIAVMRDRPSEGLAPASSSAVVDDHLNTIGSEGALSPEGERAAMARGWSPPR
jgi:hypothetical protein